MTFEFSAGGIVFKKDKEQTLILLAQHAGHHGWVFPKGHIDPSTSSGRKETKEEAALREVTEETGVVGNIMQPFEPVTYWFVQNGGKIKKTVYYFLMDFVSGDITKHDDEMEQVAWLPLEEVAKRLTYQSDKKVWEEAKILL